ncbi:hypothetical protein [Effusibacillus dendaii]
MKKCAHFAQECQDQEIRQLIDQTGQMHLRHYNMLLQQLMTNNRQGMQQVPQSAGQTASQQPSDFQKTGYPPLM